MEGHASGSGASHRGHAGDCKERPAGQAVQRGLHAEIERGGLPPLRDVRNGKVMDRDDYSVTTGRRELLISMHLNIDYNEGLFEQLDSELGNLVTSLQAVRDFEAGMTDYLEDSALPRSGSMPGSSIRPWGPFRRSVAVLTLFPKF